MTTTEEAKSHARVIEGSGPAVVIFEGDTPTVCGPFADVLTAFGWWRGRDFGAPTSVVIRRLVAPDQMGTSTSGYQHGA